MEKSEGSGVTVSPPTLNVGEVVGEAVLILIALFPMKRVPWGARLKGVSAMSTLGPLGTRWVPWMEKPLGLGVNVSPLKVSV